MKTLYAKFLVFASCLSIPGMLTAQTPKPVLKVDLNIASRRAAEVNEFEYTTLAG